MSPALADVLGPYGWSDRIAAFYPTGSIPARVVRVDRDRVRAITVDGEIAVHGHPLPAVGDWLAVAPDAEGFHVVVDTVPRWSTLTRIDPGSSDQDVDAEQVLAANIDVVLICAPLDRPLSIARIERELVVAWESGAQPVVVLTKADSCDDPDGVVHDLGERLVGTEVILASVPSGLGIEAVRRRLQPNLTGALLGASGAGKSTLTNALLGTDRMATSSVRELDHRGTHTTTVRQLLAVPGGGVLIDAPGIRSVGVGTASEGVDLTFPELTELASQCRFRDCSHESEPGCAVRDALDDGTLDPARHESWRKLLREVAAAERRTDPKAAAAYRSEIKRRNKALKQHYEHKGR